MRSESLDSRVARMIDPSGEEYVRCWCNKVSAFRVEGSETMLENVAPGLYTFVIEELDGTINRYALTVVEGQTVEVLIR